MATKKPNASPERAEFPYENGHSEVKSTIFYHIFRHQQAPKTAPKTINPPFSVTKSTCMRLQRLQPSGDEFPICSKSVPGANLELPNELEMERTAECSYPVKIVCRQETYLELNFTSVFTQLSHLQLLPFLAVEFQISDCDMIFADAKSLCTGELPAGVCRG